jgi:hypothetical protein
VLLLLLLLFFTCILSPNAHPGCWIAAALQPRLNKGPAGEVSAAAAL